MGLPGLSADQSGAVAIPTGPGTVFGRQTNRAYLPPNAGPLTVRVPRALCVPLLSEMDLMVGERRTPEFVEDAFADYFVECYNHSDMAYQGNAWVRHRVPLNPKVTPNKQRWETPARGFGQGPRIAFAYGLEILAFTRLVAMVREDVLREMRLDVREGAYYAGLSGQASAAAKLLRDLQEGIKTHYGWTDGVRDADARLVGQQNAHYRDAVQWGVMRSKTRAAAADKLFFRVPRRLVGWLGESVATNPALAALARKVAKTTMERSDLAIGVLIQATHADVLPLRALLDARLAVRFGAKTDDEASFREAVWALARALQEATSYSPEPADRYIAPKKRTKARALRDIEAEIAGIKPTRSRRAAGDKAAAAKLRRQSEWEGE